MYIKSFLTETTLYEAKTHPSLKIQKLLFLPVFKFDTHPFGTKHKKYIPILPAIRSGWKNFSNNKTVIHIYADLRIYTVSVYISFDPYACFVLRIISLYFK